MRTTLLAFVLLLLAYHSFGQENKRLSKTLDSLYNADYSWHQLSLEVETGLKDTLSKAYIFKKIGETDSTNYLAVRSIFDQYGYPNFDMVGDSSEHHFWILVQHADKHPDFQQKVLDAMKAQVDKEDASAMDYAYLVDRIETNAGRLQIYGTQVVFNKEKQAYELKPVNDPGNLDKRREEMSLPSIEKFLQDLNDHYHGIKRTDDNDEDKDKK